MKKTILLLLAFAVGVGIVGCSGEEPVEKAPPVSSNDKNNFQVTTDLGGGAASEDGAPAGKSGGEAAGN